MAKSLQRCQAPGCTHPAARVLGSFCFAHVDLSNFDMAKAVADLAAPGEAPDSRPGDLTSSLVEPFWERVEIHEGPARFLADFVELPAHIQPLFATRWSNSEIANGGMLQFFLNSTGVLAPEAVAGYRALGLDDLADNLQSAMAWFGADYPRERRPRVDRLGALGIEVCVDPPAGADPFEAFTRRHYKLERDDRWERAADDYARAHGAGSR